MSAYSKEHLKQLYPNLNFDMQLIVTKLTKEEIDKYCGKKQEPGNTSNPPANKKPLISLRKDIIDKRYLDIVVSPREEELNTANDVIPNINIPDSIQNDDNKEMNASQEDDTSNEVNDFMPNIIIPQDIQNDDMMETDVSQEDDTSDGVNDFMPNIIIPQDIQNDDRMEINASQEDDTLNGVNDFMPNIIIPQDIQNEDNMETNVSQEDDTLNGVNYFMPNMPVIAQNYNIHATQEVGNMYHPSHGFIPNMMIPHYIQNDGNIAMDRTQENEDIYKPSCSYIPNMKIKQEIQEEIANSYDSYTTQGEEGMSNMDENYSEINIKQEIVDESYNNSYMPQENVAMVYNTNGEYIPNIYQQTQNSDNSGIQVNPHFRIKQEILDNGNIEIYHTYVNAEMGCMDAINGPGI